jgi:hypothetical protein
MAPSSDRVLGSAASRHLNWLFNRFRYCFSTWLWLARACRTSGATAGPVDFLEDFLLLREVRSLGLLVLSLLLLVEEELSPALLRREELDIAVPSSLGPGRWERRSGKPPVNWLVIGAGEMAAGEAHGDAAESKKEASSMSLRPRA